MSHQAVFNRQVGVQQADHGPLAEIGSTLHRLVDFLKYLQSPETQRKTCSKE